MKCSVIKNESLKTIMDEIAVQVEIINERGQGYDSKYGCYTFPRWEFITSEDIASVDIWKYNSKNDTVVFVGNVYLNMREESC